MKSIRALLKVKYVPQLLAGLCTASKFAGVATVHIMGKKIQLNSLVILAWIISLLVSLLFDIKFEFL